jgi:UDP:flavonoid glycosyltransferase YjiC (YdhE family)
MARILMCWELGSGLAYIEGLTLVAKMFKRAGHEVIFAARDLGQAERLLGGKFQFYQAPTQVFELDKRLPLPMTFADVLNNLGYGIPDNVTARVRAWRNLLDHVKPDIVRCAHSPGALLAARGTSIRTIPVGIGFLQPPPVSPLPNLRTWDKTAVPERMAAREQQVLAGMNQGLDAIGAPRVTSVGALYNEIDICELYTYPELDDYGPRDRVKYLGNFQPGFGDSPTWPTRGGKRIFAYLQTFKLIPQALQALADTGQAVLVYMSGAHEGLRTRFAGSNLAFVDRPLNIAETAMQCDLGVSHGGHNIVGSLMQAGKPQLCLPTLLPERLTAEKIERLGTGLMTNVQFTDVQEKLSRLLQEPDFADRARALGGRLAHLTIENAMKGALESVENLV